MFSDLEKMCSAIYVGDLEKCGRRFGETRLAIWRNPFGENIGDLEKRGRCSYGDFVLEFVME